MANIRLIRRRIRSIQNTAKITRAMEMIATSKLRRAQSRVLAARPYAEKMREVLADLAAQAQEGQHPLLERRPVHRVAVIHITPDRGLCGGLNTGLNRLTAGFLLEQGVEATVVALGKKGRDFMVRRRHPLGAEFVNLGDQPSVVDVAPIARCVVDDYTHGLVDQVYLVYAEFVSTLQQRPVMRELLPIEPTVVEQARNAEYIYEPSAAAVLAQLLPRYVEMQVFHALLEAIASEQSARMVAMRNATDNANDMIQELTLIYNKARQETITTELLDIVGGVATLER